MASLILPSEQESNMSNFARVSQLEATSVRCTRQNGLNLGVHRSFRPLRDREAQEIVLSCSRAACLLRSGVARLAVEVQIAGWLGN